MPGSREMLQAGKIRLVLLAKGERSECSKRSRKSSRKEKDGQGGLARGRGRGGKGIMGSCATSRRAEGELYKSEAYCEK